MRVQSKVAVGVLLVVLLQVFFGCSLFSGAVDENGVNTDQINQNLTEAFAFAGRLTQELGGAVEDGYMVVAQRVVEDGEAFRAFTDSAGNFQIDIPEGFAGSDFILELVDQAGKTIGPVVFDVQNQVEAVTGLTFDKMPALGDIEIPLDITNGLIGLSSAASNVTAQVNNSINARLNTSGIPTGMTTFGKGAESLVQTALSTTNLIDADLDGLIDMFDADDDGDGIIDDFEPDTNYVKQSGFPVGYSVQIIQVLSLQPYQLSNYYDTTLSEVSNGLIRDSYLEIWVNIESNLNVASLSVLEKPGPAYLQTAEAGPANAPYLWSSQQYEIPLQGDGFYKTGFFPRAVPGVGDNFVFRVVSVNGETNYYSRMLNYVFYSPVRLLKYGVSGALSNYSFWRDPQAPMRVIGEDPVMDASQDLVFVFNPPKDEQGNWITNIDSWSFVVGYTMGSEYNVDDSSYGIEHLSNATWTSAERAAVPNFDGSFDAVSGTLRYELGSQDWQLENGSNYIITLPKEMFVTQALVTENKEVVNPETGATNLTNVLPVSGYQFGIRATIKGSYSEFGIGFKRLTN